MMPILRPIFRLLRRAGVATSHEPIRRLSYTSRPLLSFMAFAPPCWSPPPLARRVFPLMIAPDLPVNRDSRFPPGSRSMASNRGLKGDEPDRPDKLLLISSTNDNSAISQVTKKVEASVTTLEVTDAIAGKIVSFSGYEKNGRSVTKDAKSESQKKKRDTKRKSESQKKKKGKEASDNEKDNVFLMEILPRSTHRDGSMYMSTHSWKRKYTVDDRSETRLADPTDCFIHNGKCVWHKPTRVLQFFSLKLAEVTVDVGPVELYGYIAVRDGLDTGLNYVVNISRDDPIILKQGSLVNMTGPKRGIDMYSSILVEFDMRIKAGEHERDDHQLIDGASGLADLWGPWNRAFTSRIYGDCGAVDITVARIDEAVMASVEVVVSEVHSSFDLCFRCFIDGFNEEIRLFDGAIDESRRLKRSVVAVVNDSAMDLKFNVASEPSCSAEHCCSFKADTHGLATQEIKTVFGLISVKVTWSTLLTDS